MQVTRVLPQQTGQMMFYGAGFVHRVITMLEQKKGFPQTVITGIYIVLSRSVKAKGPISFT